MEKEGGGGGLLRKLTKALTRRNEKEPGQDNADTAGTAEVGGGCIAQTLQSSSTLGRERMGEERGLLRGSSFFPGIVVVIKLDMSPNSAF